MQKPSTNEGKNSESPSRQVTEGNLAQDDHPLILTAKFRTNRIHPLNDSQELGPKISTQTTKTFSASYPESSTGSGHKVHRLKTGDEVYIGSEPTHGGYMLPHGPAMWEKYGENTMDICQKYFREMESNFTRHENIIFERATGEKVTILRAQNNFYIFCPIFITLLLSIITLVLQCITVNKISSVFHI
jgi:hypothetical protein